MTDDMMALRTLLGMSSDADLLREMPRLREDRLGGRRKVGFTVQRLMDLEPRRMA